MQSPAYENTAVVKRGDQLSLTPIRVLAPGTGKTRLARFWVYAVDQRPHAGCDPPAAFYCYSADRRGERPRSHLAGFSGILQADAFTGYDALYRPEPGKPARILPAACWAHARRALFEAHESTNSPIAEEALRRIQTEVLASICTLLNTHARISSTFLNNLFWCVSRSICVKRRPSRLAVAVPTSVYVHRLVALQD
jgi:hypothetical protein